jgi:protein TonB
VVGARAVTGWRVTARYLAAAGAGVVLVLLLFASIEGMLELGSRVHGASSTARLLDFARTPSAPSELAPQRPTLRKPLRPTTVPALARLARPPAIELPIMPIESDAPAFAIAPARSGAIFATPFAFTPSGDSDVVPILRDAPRYPREALVSRTEGWVEVEFTIAADGTVKDAVVVGAQPDRVFERDALRAIARWKFKPLTVGGIPVERRARQIIEFTLDSST